jgi:hypothetical protein
VWVAGSTGQTIFASLSIINVFPGKDCNNNNTATSGAAVVVGLSNGKQYCAGM